MNWRAMKEMRASGHGDGLETFIREKEVEERKRMASRINNIKV